MSNPSQHQFPSYSNRKCKKITVFTYRSPHFCFPWRRPCDYHAICCMDGKTIQCLPNPRSIYPSIFNSFRVIRCVSPKIVIFTTFLFPLGDARGAITLNVVSLWMEREFDAYKLSRCMCPSNTITVSQIERDIGRKWSFLYPFAFDVPVRGGVHRISAILFGTEKLEWLSY